MTSVIQGKLKPHKIPGQLEAKIKPTTNKKSPSKPKVYLTIKLAGNFCEADTYNFVWRCRVAFVASLEGNAPQALHPAGRRPEFAAKGLAARCGVA
jgi:hypothetical protein